MSITADAMADDRPRVGPLVQVPQHDHTGACFIRAHVFPCSCMGGDHGAHPVRVCSYHGVWWRTDHAEAARKARRTA